jgi:hypothetical protein
MMFQVVSIQPSERDGRQPKGLRLAEMLGSGPLAWEEQRVNWEL